MKNDIITLLRYNDKKYVRKEIARRKYFWYRRSVPKVL